VVAVVVCLRAGEELMGTLDIGIELIILCRVSRASCCYVMLVVVFSLTGLSMVFHMEQEVIYMFVPRYCGR
jgi:hypothetical protein